MSDDPLKEGLEVRVKAIAAGATERWVTADGYTQLPAIMRDALGLQGGGHLWFLGDGGRWEAWKESDLTRALGGNDATSEDPVAAGDGPRVRDRVAAILCDTFSHGRVCGLEPDWELGEGSPSRSVDWLDEFAKEHRGCDEFDWPAWERSADYLLRVINSAKPGRSA